LDILSRLKILEILEKELVPTVLRLHYNFKDAGAKAYLRTIRNFWKSEFDLLEASILDIVDATALCAVIDDEVRTTAAEIKKRTYAQVSSLQKCGNGRGSTVNRALDGRTYPS
jgi:hypothetical protein